MRQDSPDISAVDIHGYHPPWHNMPDFAGLRMDPQDLQHFNPQNGGPQVQFIGIFKLNNRSIV